LNKCLPDSKEQASQCMSVINPNDTGQIDSGTTGCQSTPTIGQPTASRCPVKMAISFINTVYFLAWQKRTETGK